MKRRDIAIRAGKSLRQAKARTILTSLAIAVGATTICLALAAGNGARDFITNFVGMRGDDRVIDVWRSIPPENLPPTPDGPPLVGATPDESPEWERGAFSEADIEEFRAIAGVTRVSRHIWVSGHAVVGLDGDYVVNTVVQQNRQLVNFANVANDYRLKPNEVAIAEWYLGVLGFDNIDQAIGQTITLRFYADPRNLSPNDPELFDREFQIVAGISSDDRHFSQSILISYEDGEAIAATQDLLQSWTLLVEVAEGYDLEAVQRQIESQNQFNVARSMQDSFEEMFQVINIAQWGLMGFGGLAILASIFGVINTQYISVLERTRQIGLMKALGMKRKDVARLFRYEAAWIGAFGGLIGVFVAFLVTLLNPVINNVLELEDGVRMLQINPLQAIILIISLALVAVLAGYFPARRAAKLDPIKALRTE